MSKWVDISGISIPSDENDYYELVEFADAIAGLDPIDMETIQAEAYNCGIDSERKRIADSWGKAEYERGYKDGRESAERKRCKYCADERSFIGATISLENDGRWHKIRYCPNCGCRMKGADDESVDSN